MAAEELLPLVYDELRNLARRHLANEPPGQTLQSTALVHEAWLRVSGAGGGRAWTHRGHFFAAAAEAMRRVLIDNARRKQRVKHGGEMRRIPFEKAEIAVAAPVDELIAVDEVLDELAKVDTEAAELVKLRYFAGLSTEESADILGISARSAYRDWQFARAWLHKRIRGPHEAE